MTKRVRRKSHILPAVFFWSVISAAFIGPGTVTTASKAGSQFGVSLIWALCFSVLATIVLQEAAARLTITTGKNLGEHLRMQFDRQRWVPVVVWACIAFGCAAFEAGNILGAVSGMQVILPGNGRIYTVCIVLVAGLLLYHGDIRKLAHILGLVVAVMGICFIVVASQTSFTAKEILHGTLIPHFTPGTALLVIGLVGTTVVPYNLFLGSRMGQGQQLRTMRFGLILAVVIGGLISVSILLTGTLVTGELDFVKIADALHTGLGQWAGIVFAVGLCAAGLTSAVTAPLAAAITAQSIFPSWQSTSWQYRAVWSIVLFTGFVLGMLQLRPIPVILAAQMINGMLLPFIACILFALAFRATPGTQQVSSLYLVFAWLVIIVVNFLGVHSLLVVIERVGVSAFTHESRYLISGTVSLMMGCLAMWWRNRP